MPDRNTQELLLKVSMLARRHFYSDYKRMFDHYATNPRFPGQIDQDGLASLLADAGIGNGITRPQWVRGVMSAVDKNNDGFVSLL